MATGQQNDDKALSHGHNTGQSHSDGGGKCAQSGV